MNRELVIVALGDSLTESGKVGEPCYANMLCELINENLEGKIRCRLINAGRGAGTTAGVRPETSSADMSWIQDEVISQRPHLVWIMLGFNDLRNHLITEDDYVTNMRKIIAAIRDECGAKMVLADPAHMIDYEGYGPMWNCGNRDKADRFCKLVQQLGEEFDVPVANVYMAMNHDDSLIREDGIHPNEQGQQRIAGAFWEVMKNWNFKNIARVF